MVSLEVVWNMGTVSYTTGLDPKKFVLTGNKLYKEGTGYSKNLN